MPGSRQRFGRVASALRLRRASVRRGRELVLHLTAREVIAGRRFTLLGAAWPLARLLALFAVLLVLFTQVVDLGIDDYAIFLLTGLVAWTWFLVGATRGASSLLDQRHLLFRSSCPAEVIPVVAVTVAAVDALIALPVLLGMVIALGQLHPAALALPLIAAIQLILLCGIAWLAAAATVYLRDVRDLVTVGLTLLFYVTPVFYSLARVPEGYRWLLELNPLARLIEAYRDVLVDQQLPDVVPLLVVTGFSLALAGLGLAVFRRLRPGFVDEL